MNLDLLFLEEVLNGFGDGSGNGCGDGFGTGFRHGYGDEYGDGFGDGNGDGYGLLDTYDRSTLDDILILCNIKFSYNLPFYKSFYNLPISKLPLYINIENEEFREIILSRLK